MYFLVQQVLLVLDMFHVQLVIIAPTQEIQLHYVQQGIIVQQELLII